MDPVRITYSGGVYHLSKDGDHPLCSGNYSGTGADRYRLLRPTDRRAKECKWCRRVLDSCGPKTVFDFTWPTLDIGHLRRLTANDPIFVRLEAVASLLHVPERVIDAWVQSGALRRVFVGPRSPRLVWSDVLDFLGSESVEGALLRNGVQPIAEPSPPEPEVYFMRRAADSYIKIGWSRDVEARARVLGAEVLVTIPGGRLQESALHRVFRRWRADGEWFRPVPSILALIDDLQAVRARNDPAPDVVGGTTSSVCWEDVDDSDLLRIAEQRGYHLTQRVELPSERDREIADWIESTLHFGVDRRRSSK